MPLLLRIEILNWVRMISIMNPKLGVTASCTTPRQEVPRLKLRFLSLAFKGGGTFTTREASTCDQLWRTCKGAVALNLQVALEMEVPPRNQIVRRNLLWGVCILLLLPCEAGVIKSLFIFGDSLSDPGNNNYLDTLARVNFPPNGIDFPGGAATGRISNGRTGVDILAQLGGLPTFVPPYLAPNTTGKAILNGVNYASGAGGIRDSTGYAVNERLSMNKQLEYFGNTKAQIVSQLGEAAGTELISNALYWSNMGSNDYLSNYYGPLSPIGNLTSAQVATLLVRDYHGQLTRLYNMGARKVVVISLGPIGCISFQLTIRFSKNGECNEKVNVDVRLFNVEVLAMVNQLNAELPGAHFLYADAYKGTTDMISNPTQYGFKVITRDVVELEEIIRA